MSFRIYILAFSLLIYLLLMLSNLTIVKVDFIVKETNVPLFYLIGISTLYGALVSFIFMSLNASGRRVKKMAQSAIEKKNKDE